MDNKCYYTAQAWMVNDLGLTGDELTVFAIIWGFSQDGETASRTPVRYIMEWLGCGKPKALRVIACLVNKGIIERDRKHGCISAYKVVSKSNQYQNDTTTSIKMIPGGIKIEPLNNNINIIKNKANTRAREEKIKDNERFEEWFNLYTGGKRTRGRGGCWSFWQMLDEDEQLQVIAHTKRYIQVAVSPLQPYHYLTQYQLWRDERPTRAGIKAEPEKPTEDMVVVKDGDGYKAVTREFAEQNKLQII